MASNAHEVVAEALRSTLEAISTINGYAYTPDAVRRVAFWPDATQLDASRGPVLYFVRSGPKVTSWYDGRRLERREEFRILCCHAFEEATEHPLDADPVRERMCSEMEADVVKTLWADVRLGQPGYVIDAMAEGWQTDPDWYVPRWAVVELRIVVRYQHPQDGR